LIPFSGASSAGVRPASAALLSSLQTSSPTRLAQSFGAGSVGVRATVALNPFSLVTAQPVSVLQTLGGSSAASSQASADSLFSLLSSRLVNIVSGLNGSSADITLSTLINFDLLWPAQRFSPPVAARNPLNSGAVLPALTSKNWMGYLPDRMRLFDVVIPGSHDTGTYGYTIGSLITNLNITTSVQTNEERASFKAQLDNGIRFWDVRVTKVSDTLGDNLKIYHGPFDVGTTLDQALASARQFLEENPGETLVIALKKENNFDSLFISSTASSEIGAADIEAYLAEYNINARLPAGSNGLWVAGPTDFQQVLEARTSKALNDLNDINSGFQLETRNPRVDSGVKLAYQNLVLGDVRGKIVLLMRDFADYASASWSASSIVALDSGAFTGGVYMQDNYEGPSYAEKKADILSHAKGTYGNPSNAANRFAWNFTSASTGVTGGWSQDWLVNPATYALTINAGSVSNGYKTDDTGLLSNADDTASLKTMLSAGGELTAWNLVQKRAGSAGLRGSIAGDYFLAPQDWYDHFWDSSLYSRSTLFPDLNSSAYSVSDHLTQLIWRQNAIARPVFGGGVKDPVTGLLTYREGQQINLGFVSYLGNQDSLGLDYQIVQVDAREAGLNAAQIAAASLAGSTSRITARIGDQSRGAFGLNFSPDSQLIRGQVNFTGGSQVAFDVVGDVPNDGTHIFRFDLINPLNSVRIGAAQYFAVTDA